MSARPSAPVRIDGRLPPPLIDSPAFVLMQAGRLAQEWTAQALEPCGLTVAEFAAMSIMRALGAIKQAALAERLGISQVATSSLASGLVDRGLAQRFIAFRDCRTRLLGLTEEGLDTLTKATEAVANVEARFPGEVVQTLASLLPEDLGPVVELIRQLGWG
jgi:DNA-binding MarR family transcriptional regulator